MHVPHGQRKEAIMKRKKWSCLAGFGMVALLAAGCGTKPEEANKGAASYTVAAQETDADEKYQNLSEWNGEWESFVNYCDNDELDDAWDRIAEDSDLTVEKLKDTFKQICFMTDDVKYFEVRDGVITGLDSDRNEVFRHEYVLIDSFAKDSEETVIEGDVSYLFQATEDAGRYSYLCLMPICTMEDVEGMEMLDHFHFNFGATAEQATDRSGIPTMIEDTSEDAEKTETLLTFFFGFEE